MLDEKIMNKIIQELNTEISLITQGYLDFSYNNNLFEIFLKFSGNNNIAYPIIILEKNLDPHFIKQKIISALKSKLD